jgi:hypothetical protein
MQAIRLKFFFKEVGTRVVKNEYNHFLAVPVPVFQGYGSDPFSVGLWIRIPNL